MGKSLVIGATLLVMLGMLLVTGVYLDAQDSDAHEGQIRVDPWPPGRVIRHTDEEAGVVCWIYEGYGMSCLPIGDTALGQ